MGACRSAPPSPSGPTGCRHARRVRETASGRRAPHGHRGRVRSDPAAAIPRPRRRHHLRDRPRRGHRHVVARRRAPGAGLGHRVADGRRARRRSSASSNSRSSRGSAGRASARAVDRWLLEQENGPRPAMELGSLEAMKQAVLSGLGVSVLPEPAVKADADRGALRVGRFPGTPIKARVDVAVLEGQAGAEAARGVPAGRAGFAGQGADRRRRLASAGCGPRPQRHAFLQCSEASDARPGVSGDDPSTPGFAGMTAAGLQAGATGEVAGGHPGLRAERGVVVGPVRDPVAPPARLHGRDGGRGRDGNVEARSPSAELLGEQVVLAPGGGGGGVEVPTRGVVDHPGGEIVHLDGADGLGTEVIERDDAPGNGW